MAWSWLPWEAAVLAAAARLAWCCGWRGGAGAAAAETLLAVLSLDIVIASLVAAALSFARANSPAAYLAMAGVLLAVAFAPGARRAAADLRGALQGIFTRPLPCAALAVVILPLLLLSLRPVEQADSLYYLHFMLEWVANRLTPYHFPFQFVPFWELGFVPSMVLARADLFFGVVALKAPAVLALAVYLAGRELALPRPLLLLVAAAAMSFRHLWWGHSGVSTLKNDTLHGAGAVLLAVVLLRAVQAKSRPTDAVLMALGVAFALVKFSGPILAVAALAVVWWLHRPRLRTALATVAFTLLASGHYYLHNLIVFGNPVYPFQINALGLHLPGTADVSYTSIAYSFRDPRLWRAFFLPPGGLSPAGPLFPLVLAGALAVCAWLTAAAVVRFVRHREAPAPAAWLAGFILAGWLVYFRSLYSGSASPGDLGYVLNDLSSLRYADGPLALSELLLAALLYRATGPALPAILAALQLAGRLWLLYRHIPLDVFPLNLVLGASLGWAGLFLACSAVRRTGWRAALVAALLVAPVALGGGWVTERNRRHWVEWWQDLHEPFHRLASATVFTIEDPLAGESAGHYLFAGLRFQHDVRVGKEDDLARWQGRYIVKLISPGAPRPDFAAFARRLAPRGYFPVLAGRYGVVLEHLAPLDAPAPAEAWLLPPGRLPVPGTAVDEGAGAPRLRRLRGGEFVYSPDAGRVLLIGDHETRYAEPAGEARLRIVNAGPLDQAGRPEGLACVYRGGAWHSDPGAAPRLNPDFDFREAYRTRALGQRFVSVSQGAARQEYLAGPDGPFLRLHATGDTGWLVVAGTFPALPASWPVTVRAQVRCPAPANCTLTAVGQGAIERSVRVADRWETLAIPLRRNPADGGYYAVGRKQSRAGDCFDVRELSLLPGFFPAGLAEPPFTGGN